MDLFDYLAEMRGLHGALITSFTWTPDAREVELRIEDLYGSIRGTPEYPGQQSGSVTLYGVSDLNMTVGKSVPLRIFEFFPEAGATDVVLITFWPAGWIRIRFTAAECLPGLSAARSLMFKARTGRSLPRSL